MRQKRIPISGSVETSVLLASRRRCCICFYLHKREEVRRGRLAHLDGNPAHSSFENIVWLCLEHHDQFDSRTSQSKGYTVAEVRSHRDHLYAHFNTVEKAQEAEPEPEDEFEKMYSTLRKSHLDELDFSAKPWRFPLWQTANEPEFFAYKAGSRADGVCLIERIHLPDGRIVIICIETAGNPGNSITNCVEEICFQVCARFRLDPERIVWIEHYDYIEPPEWDMVQFGTRPSVGPFADPVWTPMDDAHWKDLKLKPKRYLRSYQRSFASKLVKLFPWESDSLDSLI